MSFALELAKRIRGRASFQADLDRLQVSAASATLDHPLERDEVRTDLGAAPINATEIRRLLYCAGVFLQTDDERLRATAQSIALGALLIGDAEVPVDASLRLLTDLGNFPALTYAEQRFTPDQSLRQALRGAISREINSITVGDQRIALTDFQKRAWDRLHHADAVAVSAPTSAGKSFLVIEHMCRTIEQAKTYCAVYVAPTRALLSEVYGAIQKRLSGDPSIRVSTVPTIDPSHPARQVFILTQERLQVLLAVSSIVFDLVVVDEAQNLSDGARGMILQECLEQAFGRALDTRLVLLAPGAQGFEDVARLIGLKAFEAAVSLLPSVIQNRILVSKANEPRTLNLRLLTASGPVPLGLLRSARGFDTPSTRLAAVALELGATGGSLVYATGPKDAETVALQLFHDSRPLDLDQLNELAEFIERHIHKEYALAKLVRRGVAFHYGRMPSLLRESIEGAFKTGALRFLACTTTLFQGVNLPARNVFIDTPTRGVNAKLDPAALWNFAGRAGRMKADIVGNVFLVDYDEWPEKPMDSFVGYKIEPAFAKTVEDLGPAVIEALKGDMPRQTPNGEDTGRTRAAAGLLISRAAKGDVAAFASRSLGRLPAEELDMIVKTAETASETIGLPASLLATNWTIDPFGLKRLYVELVAKISAGMADDLIPRFPEEYMVAREAYTAIFNRAQRAVNLNENRFPALVSGVAVKWMQGAPYPLLLSDAIKRARKQWTAKNNVYEEELARNPRTRKRKPSDLDVNDVIRKEFDLIEDVIRFQYVQLGKAYVDILTLALRKCGLETRIREIFDFPLALELGVSTRSAWSFMELGLSRIGAGALESQFPNSELSVGEAREWLRSVDVRSLKLNSVIVNELIDLGLVAEPIENPET
ncbi:DEAD/DEAH box helicase [Brevundimonas sanguinis]|uniref:DEAD/DEAH box helicase n=1 Tax=Brevundimonas sanguinis TaxID=3021811 RepID=UPI00241539BF|nr:DEAD/DEAH box helicase [Brevundimonas sp. NCCP 15609]